MQKQIVMRSDAKCLVVYIFRPMTNGGFDCTT